ncbi:hypothetical protein ACX0AN_002287 [Acinetobacter baumannii]|uniref:hypothetical protein n=1 Tax=Acinetobacter baumannii TaxID=470 RepID=UPI00145A3139|nr:hypothetical protein [Acinetobacter baumannii]EKT8316939.1 hypothetical protein [Acinetobacter baumannii]EKT9347921.1 hypothetical protein [Acinetobacter baumannii]EKT9979441.1 hypothetical protein [Acinetobacter baumannii]EKU0000858.1 hypothetical protein [Acinetobacter baumannii]EKU0004685.1 hypothetical protein [Acinetobacter baumannii]
MDTKSVASVSIIVIESLMMLVEHEGIELPSISLKLKSEDGSRTSKEVDFAHLVEQTLKGLKELSEGKQDKEPSHG